MQSHSEIFKIIKSWINFTTAHKLLDKKKDFFLLCDYLMDYCSPDFYSEHYNEAKEILDSLDTEKEEVQKVKRYLMPIVGKYAI